jgi:hypothetical protein
VLIVFDPPVALITPPPTAELYWAPPVAATKPLVAPPPLPGTLPLSPGGSGWGLRESSRLQFAKQVVTTTSNNELRHLPSNIALAQRSTKWAKETLGISPQFERAKTGFGTNDTIRVM